MSKVTWDITRQRIILDTEHVQVCAWCEGLVGGRLIITGQLDRLETYHPDCYHLKCLEEEAQYRARLRELGLGNRTEEI